MALPPSKALARFAGLADEPTAVAERSLSWLGRLAMAAPWLPMPARMLPAPDQRLVRLYRLVQGTALFDPPWYVDRYPGARAAGGDPLRHFLVSGAAHGFLPSPHWRGLDADGCAALAERHGKAGRSLWRYMRSQRGSGADAFLGAAGSTRELTPIGPLSAAAFLRALDCDPGTVGRLAIDLLVVDHAMGGGANRYRDQRLAQALELEQIVALLTYRLSEDRYRLELCDGDSIVLVTTGQLAELGELLQRLTLGRILLNNLVSYPDVRRMIDTIRRVTASNGAKLELPLHDFFAVCPSFNLLDDRQEFCGVPELDRCRACIARVDLPEPVCDAPRAIDAWREAWSPLLLEARDIIAFSGSSRELFARAYPDLGHQRVVVRPHTVDYLPQRKVAVETNAPLHIGVVGEISYAKGAEVVAELFDLLQRTRSPARLSVIGTLDKRYAGDIPQTGRYRAVDLPDLLAELGINVCLVPSIWPETFCYVAEELIRLGMPVAAFDLGAPAERLRDYPAGLVLTSREPALILGQLEAFWRALGSAGHHIDSSGHRVSAAAS